MKGLDFHDYEFICRLSVAKSRGPTLSTRSIFPFAILYDTQFHLYFICNVEPYRYFAQVVPLLE